MLECYVSGQSLKLYTPVIAADSLHYLTGQVHFSGADWAGHSAWLHFRQGETVYDVALDAEGAFGAEAELSLTLGEWTLYLTGTDGVDRLTTVSVMLTVKESGLVDAPLHPMPLSVAEQIDSKANTALAFAAEVKAAAEAGDFDGRDGTSFVIQGYYDTFDAMTASVPEPEAGEAYGIGTTVPYDIYIWDEVNGLWRNNGTIQGVKGDRGERGATFTPAVDSGGNLSWTNDAGLPNPATQNIRGPAGEAGAAGPAGKGAFDVAVEAGYTGTEATFNTALAAVPYHNARHLPGGADPITVQTGNLANSAVTKEKIASDSVSRVISNLSIGTTWTASLIEKTKLLSPDGTQTQFTIDDAPASLIRVALASAPSVDVGGYTYSSGTLTFDSAPAAGTNTYVVTYNVNGAPYTQTIPATGLLSTDKVLVDAVLPVSVSDAEAIAADYSSVYKISVSTDLLTVYSLDVTSVAIPISVMVVSR